MVRTSLGKFLQSQNKLNLTEVIIPRCTDFVKGVPVAKRSTGGYNMKRGDIMLKELLMKNFWIRMIIMMLILMKIIQLLYHLI